MGSTESLQASTNKLRQSAVHEAMRKIGSDAPRVDSSASEVKPTDVLEATGAAVLERWSKSHENAQGSKVAMPVVRTEDTPMSPEAHSQKPKRQTLVDMYPPTAAPET